jgi:hypothetical protein
MNPNNTDISSLDFANTHDNNSILEAYLYFCRSGKAYAIKGKNDSHYAYLEDVVAPHLAKTIKITEATCLTNEVRVTTCFCEHVMNTEIIENSALGHEYKEENKVYIFSSIYAEATSCMTCTRQCGINSETVNEGYVISDYGYSSCEYNNKVGVSRTFNVNKELLAEFENVNGGVEIGFGITPQKENETPNTLDDFAVSAALKKADDEAIYSTISFIVTYGSDEYKGALIYIAGYAKVKGEVDFVDDTFEAKSYNSIVAEENEKAQ